jgi:CRP-like cAMP-binding protein
MPVDMPRVAPVERLLMLLAIPEFQTLTPSELRRVASAAKLVKHAAGVALGDPRDPPAIEIVVQGMVEQRSESSVRRIEPGQVVGGLPEVLSRRQATRAIALVDTLALRLDAESLEDLLEEEFGIYRAILRGLVGSSLDRLPVARGLHSQEGLGAKKLESPELDVVERMLLMQRTLDFGVARMDVLAELAQQAEPFTRRLGAPLFRSSDPSERFVVLASGSAHCSIQNESSIVQAPIALGVLEVVGGVERRFTATAASEIRGLEVSGALFMDLLEDHPQLGLDLLRAIARTVSRAFR